MWESQILNIIIRGGFRGGGGGADASFFRDLTPYRPKGSSLCTILIYPYLVTDPEIFGRQYILILRF